MQQHRGLLVSIVFVAIMCAVLFGLYRYYDARYMRVLPMMNGPDFVLTSSQENDARCGDAANDCLFLSELFAVAVLILSVILLWKWRRSRTTPRGFDVIQ
jgi:hypothetical protein